MAGEGQHTGEDKADPHVKRREGEGARSWRVSGRSA